MKYFRLDIFFPEFGKNGKFGFHWDLPNGGNEDLTLVFFSFVLVSGLEDSEQSLDAHGPSHCGYLVRAKHADEVIVPSSSWNGSQFCRFVSEDNLVDHSCVVVESSRKRQVKGNFVKSFHSC